MVFGPAFAARDPLVKMMGTLGAVADPDRADGLARAVGGDFARFLTLPTSDHRYQVFGAFVSLTQMIALVLAFAVTVGTTVFLRYDEPRDGDAGARERPGDHRDARRAG